MVDLGQEMGPGLRNSQEAYGMVQIDAMTGCWKFSGSTDRQRAWGTVGLTVEAVKEGVRGQSKGQPRDRQREGRGDHVIELKDTAKQTMSTRNTSMETAPSLNFGILPRTPRLWAPDPASVRSVTL